MTIAHTVAIIDADRDVAEGIALRLRAADCRTVSTTSAVAARQVVAHQRPDLIVLDLELPHRAARRLMVRWQKRRRTYGIPIIGSFTDRRPSWLRGPLRAGAFLRKPFEAYTLHAAVAKCFTKNNLWSDSCGNQSRTVRIDMPAVKHVLLIDDDQDIVAGASVRLRAAGYDVVSARDGEQGVAAAASMHPDAIVLDVQMPRMNGMAALNRLKADVGTCHIPVVMLSASLAEQTAALDAGARFYLRKPYRAQTLLAALDAAVASSRTSGAKLVETNECPA